MIARGSIDKSSYKLRHRIYTIYNFDRTVLLHIKYKGGGGAEIEGGSSIFKLMKRGGSPEYW